jgi:5-methyltetrahydrofolate--homocysteine methyltransferase
MENKFLQALHSGTVLLMDGAMGTELQRAGIQQGECYEHWNLTHPERVLAIHRAYVEAGAEVLLTNTFQANCAALAKHGLQALVGTIGEAAVALARKAATPKVLVLTSIGPGEWQWFQQDAHLLKAIQAADGLLLETLDDLSTVPICLKAQALQAAAPDTLPSFVQPLRLPGPFKPLVVLASVTFLRNQAGELRTIGNYAPEAIARRARAINGISALGVNCGRDISMDDCIEIVRRYRTMTELPLFARPNAGTPQQVNGQWVYAHTPEQMAAKLPQLLAAGVAMVGGCCGTTPAHIAAFRPVIDAWNARHVAR